VAPAQHEAHAFDFRRIKARAAGKIAAGFKQDELEPPVDGLVQFEHTIRTAATTAPCSKARAGIRRRSILKHGIKEALLGRGDNQRFSTFATPGAQQDVVRCLWRALRQQAAADSGVETAHAHHTFPAPGE
jgi:hypothetical protein